MKEVDPPKGKSFLREMLELGALAIFFYALIQLGVQTVRVHGSSMYPSLSDGDFTIVSKVDYMLGQPKRGDVIVFLPNNGENVDYVKRIIAIPGDDIAIQDGVVTLNHQALKEPYVNGPWGEGQGGTWNGGKDYVLPPGKYFVMGDNRDHSRDSRMIGPQERKSFLGRDAVRLWPTFKIFPSG